MEKVYPVIHSKLAPEFLLGVIKSNYDIPKITDCRLIACQMNDTYLVNAGGDRYVFRVYRSDRKRLDEIEYELEMLSFLDKKGIPVSAPIKKNDNSFVISLNAPEGDRHAGLFKFIDGRTPNRLKGINFYSFGQALARIHKAADEFPGQEGITKIDLDYLLDRSIEKLKCKLQVSQEDCDYLKGLSQRLRGAIERLPAGELDHGFIHGDSQPDNTRIDNSGNVTYLDFDCCGQGYRVYDLATFFWTVIINMPLFNVPYLGRVIRRRINFWLNKFLDGYSSVRELKSSDIKLLPIFIAVRHIWALGLRAENVNYWGLKFMNEEMLKGSIKFIRNYERKYLSRYEKPLNFLLSLVPIFIEVSTETGWLLK